MIKIVDALNKEELTYNEEERPLYHKNCAEILLLSANEKYELGLDDRFIKAVCRMAEDYNLKIHVGHCLVH